MYTVWYFLLFLVFIVALCLVAVASFPTVESNVLATPTIPVEKGKYTSLASRKINANAAEVTVEGFAKRGLNTRLTLLDREKNKMAFRTTMYPAWLLGSELVQEVIPLKDNSHFCEYRTWYTLEGVGASFLLSMAGAEFREAFKRSAANLPSHMARVIAERKQQKVGI
ncbi:hypothetical protein BJ878DRAFT_578920 [Calycina marina]|uniref:Uncharacterized protein n=1 Tax=Calycina marina TaxID=1763456 RepID=A0A9P8CBI1_9HELO|nr:hypothetical protein BJ878DRAFT_578920 [Calycina marina]